MTHFTWDVAHVVSMRQALILPFQGLLMVLHKNQYQHVNQFTDRKQDAPEHLVVPRSQADRRGEIVPSNLARESGKPCPAFVYPDHLSYESYLCVRRIQTLKWAFSWLQSVRGFRWAMSWKERILRGAQLMLSSPRSSFRWTSGSDYVSTSAFLKRDWSCSFAPGFRCVQTVEGRRAPAMRHRYNCKQTKIKSPLEFDRDGRRTQLRK